MKRVYVVLGLWLLASLAVPVAAHGLVTPTTNPVCSVCGDALADASEDEIPGPVADAGMTPGRSGFAVVDSEATVRVTADGDARWIATTRIRWTNATIADRVAENRSLLGAYTAAQLPDDAENATGWTTANASTANGTTDTVRVAYTVPDQARGHFGGVTVLGILQNDGYGVGLPVDTFTITGPPGTTVTNEIENVTTDGRNATWEDGGVVNTYVTYAPANDPLAGLWTYLAYVSLASPVGDASGFPSQALYPAVVLWLVLGRLGQMRLDLDLSPSFETARDGFVATFYVLGILSLVLLFGVVGRKLVASLLAGTASTGLLVWPPIYAVAAGWAVWTRNRDDRQPFRAAGVALALGWATFLGTTVVTGPPVDPGDIEGVLLAAPATLLLPFGYVTGVDGQSRRRGVRTGIAAVTVLALSVSPVLLPLETVSWGAVTSLLVVPLFKPLSVLVSGVPLYVLGNAMGRRGSLSAPE